MEKRFGLIFGIIFAFVTILSLAGATLSTSSISELGHSSGSFSVNITSTENETVDINIDSIVQGSREITFSGFPSSIVLNESSEEITINYSVPSGFVFELGQSYSTNLDLNGSVSGESSKQIRFEDSNFCEGVENNGNLNIREMDFTVETGYGEDDNFWYLLDTISVDVRVDNDGSWDVRNVNVEWELYTTAGDLIADGDVSDFDVDRGDDNTITISFKIDENLRDFENEDAVFYVRATGEIDDNDSPFDGNDSCAFDSREVTVNTGDEFMIVDDVSLNGNPVERNDLLTGSISCGASVDFSGIVFNIGDREQQDAFVVINNQELGINEIIKLNDINAFKSQEISFRFNVPKNAEEKIYPLRISVYDDNNRIFENDEDDESITDVHFRVEGGCAVADPTLTADLSSGEAKEGGQIIVHAYIRNEDVKAATFILSAQGFDTWAQLVNVSAETFVLESGASKDVYLTFDLKDNSEGDKQFNLVVTSNGEVVANKPVLISISAGSFWGDFAKDANWEIIGIVALNVILLIAIIIVAVKILRRK
ncbi:putative S-layer protein [Candidatus Pacearchaeota archaeon]|nr:putative S-layer protein [Candidatus Pacearchaeota archaeon]